MSDMKNNWMDVKRMDVRRTDLERKFGRVLEEFWRRFPERRWLLETGPGLVAAMACAPEGEEETMALGLTLADSSPERFLENVLRDVWRLLGTKVGFSSLEELDLFLESVGKGRDFA